MKERRVLSKGCQNDERMAIILYLNSHNSGKILTLDVYFVVVPVREQEPFPNTAEPSSAIPINDVNVYF